jgi:hypothetical protein
VSGPGVFVALVAAPGDVELAGPAGHINVMVVGEAFAVGELGGIARGSEDLDILDADDGGDAAVGEFVCQVGRFGAFDADGVLREGEWSEKGENDGED